MLNIRGVLETNEVIFSSTRGWYFMTLECNYLQQITLIPRILFPRKGGWGEKMLYA